MNTVSLIGRLVRDPVTTFRVYMKRYLITRHQLHDVMVQEGQSPKWYGRLICLELDHMGIPVYTLTCEERRPENAPAPAYVELMMSVLRNEFKLGKRQASGYINSKKLTGRF